MHDERFSFEADFGEPELPQRPCWMNAIFAMRKLSLDKYTGNFIGRMYSYPEVQITIAPIQEGDILQRQVAIRGLFWTLYSMMTKDKFETISSVLM